MPNAILKGSLVALAVAAGAVPALAGEWHHGRAAAPWYDQPPLAGTGPGFYYGQHPTHVPGYPKPLRGHAVPIFDTSRTVVHRQPDWVSGDHFAWCAARYRSYDAATDTYQPLHGPRRYCRSPW